MKVYIAAPYGARAQARRYADQLLARGIIVTSEWVYGSRKITNDTVHTAPGLDDYTVSQFARADLRDVDNADVLILLTDSVAENEAGTSASGGRHIETGYALARGKRVIVVGEPENIFHRSTLVTVVDTWADALALVEPKTPVYSPRAWS